jgi:S1-C subfamily serine protease
LAVIKYIYNLIYNLESEPRLKFTKTKDTHSSTGSTNFKVTLGIMPDYLYEGKGVRIDGVTEGRPAANAGLKRGDTLMKLGVDEVTDMQAYMKCLGKYTKGEKVKAIVLRDGKEMEVEISF